MNSNWSYSPKTPELGQNWRFLVLCDLEIWRMTSQIIGHLFYATWSFVYHFIAISQFKLVLQTGNRAPLLCHVKLCASFHSYWWIQTGVTVRKCPNWGNICFDLCDLDLWPLTLTFCMDITFVNGNNSWQFHDDTVTGTLFKKVWQTGGQTDRQMDGRTEGWMERCVLRAAWSQLKTQRWAIAILSVVLSSKSHQYDKTSCLNIL